MEEVSDEIRKQLLFEYNCTDRAFSIEHPISYWIDRNVNEKADAIAAIYEDTRLSYKELNEKSDYLAANLQARGIACGSFVPIVMNKGLDLLVSMLAVIKTGAAYVPIDPGWPLERIRYVLDDVGSTCILVDTECKNYVEKNYYLVEHAFLEKSSIKQEVAIPLDSPLYVMYTSGSTGKPKGAIVTHRGILNRLAWMTDTLGTAAAHTILQLSNHTFDSSVWQFFWPLIHGGKTVIVPGKMEKTAYNILSYIETYNIELVHFVPSLFDLIVEQLHLDKSLLQKVTAVKYVWIGGEKLSPKTVRQFQELLPKVQLSNHYGPTETSIACLYYPIQNIPQGDIPIGKPISNVKIVLLDENRKLVPLGSPGEIYIGGAGVGLGYLHDEQKTADAFIDNPYKELGCSKLYKSGDLGRYLPDGNIQFLGRIDFQVKIRGFRVELHEIENQLSSHPGIQQVIVTTKSNKYNENYLIAYYRSEGPIHSSSLKSYLQQYLPEYMVPTHYVQLEFFPLLSNGKVNLQALPSPRETFDAVDDAPANETEKKLLAIWKDILDVRQMGRTSNFFELGCNSLKAARFNTLAFKIFGVQVSLSDIFAHQTIELLSAYIERQHSQSYESISPQHHNGPVPATSAQKRLYILNRTFGPNIAYNIPGVMVIEGELDSAKLEVALQQLVNRHESLRTTFSWVEDEPIQVIHPHFSVAIEYRQETTEAPEDVVKSFIRPFDLARGPLFRVGLMALQKENTYLFMYDVHHIVADAISVSILLQELFMFYNNETVPEIKVQYKDYAIWNNQRSREWLKHEEYWLNQFEGELPVMDLPIDLSRTEMLTFEGTREKVYLDEDVNLRLVQFCRETNTTKYMVLLAVYSIMLMKYTKQEDVIVGTPMAGRNHADIEHMIGMFINTLAIRSKPSKHKRFAEFLSEIKDIVLAAFDRQDYPFDRLVDRLQLERDGNRNPLFTTMFVLQNMDLKEVMLVSQGMHISEKQLGDLKLRPFPFEHGASKFDLMLEAVERDGRIGLKFEYNLNLFYQQTIKQFAEGYVHLLRTVLNRPDMMLAQLSSVTEPTRRRLLSEFNHTLVDYPKDVTIHQLFEEQVKRTPDKVAVIFGNQSMTYMEINEKSNQIAHCIREQGIGPNQLVGMFMERSFDMVVGILAILKAGGAYIPIDPELPESRVSYILKDSNAGVILTQRKYVSKLNGDQHVLVLDEWSGTDDRNEKQNLRPLNSSSDLAYVMYTSGTTGNPKGVMIEHHSVVNRIHWMQRTYPIGTDDTVMQKTTYVFDVSVWELFWWFFNGSTLYMLQPGSEKDPVEITRAVKEHNITVMHFVPSMFSLFLEYLERDSRSELLTSLRYVFTSGEALLIQHVQRFKALSLSQAQLINLYGPTEATIDVTHFPCRSASVTGSVPIGRPIDNIHIFILDEDLQLLPIGVPGDLWIAGVGVARGYLNLPELTNERFIPCPFRPGWIMYHSGDIARWLPDGNLDYLGRSDNQIKIRGLRIEMDEIVHTALQHGAVREAVVQVSGEHEEKKIYLYYVGDVNVEDKQVRSFLQQKLPHYMVPSFVMRLDRIPLTHNGKVDRKKLPEFQACQVEGRESEELQPSDTIEKELLELWRKLLRKDQIGLLDDFFDLGGNSLLAVKLELELESKGYPVDHIGVFRYRTIKQFADYFRSRQ
ncbi:non-ribosomal peptide synthetase [Xylanibacillus composti]|nr:non-ribosomal peptide synthetase [Xylanibacillus composti]